MPSAFLQSRATAPSYCRTPNSRPQLKPHNPFLEPRRYWLFALDAAYPGSFLPFLRSDTKLLWWAALLPTDDLLFRTLLLLLKGQGLLHRLENLRQYFNIFIIRFKRTVLFERGRCRREISKFVIDQ